jgi:hypothetical protein
MNQAAVLIFIFFGVVLLYGHYLPFKKWSRIAVLSKVAAWSSLFAIPAILILQGCTQKATDTQQLPSTDSTAFFPIHEFFTAQIEEVDSLKPEIHLFTRTGERTDSTIISIQQFNQAARPFLQNNIAEKSVKKFYRQSVFQDLSTGSITFNYTTVNTDLPVQNLDVLIDTATQQVKRVFISRIQSGRDSTVIEKLNWKADTSFVINRLIRTRENKEMTQQLLVVWRKND